MKLSDYRNTYYEFSGKTSDIARQLAFAGIALVWIFKTNNGTFPRVPKELLLPTITLALTLAFDLLQYISATIIWGSFQWNKERQLEDLSEDPELESSAKLKWPQLTFFSLKIISVIISYYFLINYLVAIWSKS